MSASVRELVVRPVADKDSVDLIVLIDTVFGEYPNCILDVDNEMPELRSPASAAKAEDAQWWVVEDAGKVVGSCAVMPEGDGTMELKRLYIAKEARRRGLAAHLVSLAETQARARGARRMELWTDTRFADAHRFYERLGYTRAPRTRALCDASHSIEFHFSKDLKP